MSTLAARSPSVLKLAAGISALLFCASLARAQPPAESAPQAHMSRAHGGAQELIRRDLVGMPDKEVVMTTIEVPPGASSPPHRHYAQVFVYVLQGTMIMQVKGGPRVTLAAGQTFYESPSDIHTVSANASKTEPAKFLAILIKDKNKPSTVLVGPHPAH